MKRKRYRHIYEAAYGPIPEGYHIHHIDGNHQNNDPSNLMAVTPEEHARLHLEMGIMWKGGDRTKWILGATDAGELGAAAFHATLSPEQKKEWHGAGGSKSSRARSSQYTYRITTDTDEVYIVNGLEFKQICKDKNWNYHTLHSRGGWGKRLLRGVNKGFMVEQISVYDKTIL